MTSICCVHTHRHKLTQVKIARCRFAHGPANTTTIHCLLLQEIQIGFGFTLLALAHPGSPGQNPASHKTVVVVVVVVVKLSAVSVT